MSTKKLENGFTNESMNSALLEDLQTSLELEFGYTKAVAVPLLEWVETINLGHGRFTFEGHEYQRGILEEDARRQCIKKAAQMGITELNILKTIWGMIHGRYAQGVGVFFPSETEVQDFSRARFATIIRDNLNVAEHVTSTDALQVKQIGRRSVLYMRGMRSTARVEGIKRTSSQLKSIAIDRCVLDECDEIQDWAMVDLVLQRLGHSEVKEELYLSTPTVPNFGIDALYNESDQRIWEIRCEHCGTWTCLEQEYMTCLLRMPDGDVIRACKKCKKEIHPRNGRWTPAFPERSKDLVGWHISQLCSRFISPKTILDELEDPPRGNVTEVFNSRLGLAHIPTESKLTVGDVLNCCSGDPMSFHSREKCCMGLDVGKMLHITIGFRPNPKTLQIAYVGRVSNFEDVHDLARKFHVEVACLDALPETRATRDFQKSEPYRVYLVFYDQNMYGNRFDDKDFLCRSNRVEILDGTHQLIVEAGRLILPRRNEEIELFAKQVCNSVKVLQEDPETGNRAFRYRATGDDHYRHSLNYCLLASEKVGVSSSSGRDGVQKQRFAEGMDYDPFNPGY